MDSVRKDIRPADLRTAYGFCAHHNSNVLESGILISAEVYLLDVSPALSVSSQIPLNYQKAGETVNHGAVIMACQAQHRHEPLPQHSTLPQLDGALATRLLIASEAKSGCSIER